MDAVDVNLSSLLDQKRDYQEFIASVPQKLRRIDEQINVLSEIPEHGTFEEMLSQKLTNYQNRRKRQELLQEKLSLETTYDFYRETGLPDIDQTIGLYRSLHPELFARNTEERTIHAPASEVPRENAVLQESPVVVSVPLIAHIPQHNQSLETELKDIPRKNASSPATAAPYELDIARFIQCRNEYKHRGLDYIVHAAGIDWIKTRDDAMMTLRYSLNKGYTIDRYDRHVAPQEMRHEMVKEYALNYEKSLKTIARELSHKYHLHVSESTIRKYARRELGHVSRRDRSAQKAYRRRIRTHKVT